MPFDMQTVQVAIAIGVGLLTILGTVFGWFGKVWNWASSLFTSKGSSATLEVPKKTMILLPMARPNALWWHMGSMGKSPAMQIVGDLNVTNISKYDVFVMGAKLKRPKAIGHAVVSDPDGGPYSSYNPIPSGGIGDLRFDFFVQPPVREKGQQFRADVAIIDQFGNEHWLKKLEFPYN